MIGYLVRAGLFCPEVNLSALCRSHRCEAEPPSSPIPHGSVHVTPARRFTAVQDVLLISPAAKEEQPLSLSVAGWYVFKSVRAEISSAGIAGSGHLLHVKVYKRNSRLLPLFSVGTRSYVKMYSQPMIIQIIGLEILGSCMKNIINLPKLYKMVGFSQNAHKNTCLWWIGFYFCKNVIYNASLIF